jgi:hypothetical protein
MNLPKIDAPIFTLELPSNGKKIKYRPFKIKEEKLMLVAAESQHAPTIIENVNNVIKNCILTKDIDVDNLPSYDAQWIFLKLREHSIGNMMPARVKCPITNEYFETELNISDAVVQKQAKRDFKIMLDKDVGIVLKDLSLMDVFSDETLEKLDQYEIVLRLMTKCLVQVFDKDNVYDATNFTQEDIIEFLEGLRKEHFDKISDFFDKLPKIKLEQEVYSPLAEKKIKIVIENFMDFFE